MAVAVGLDPAFEPGQIGIRQQFCPAAQVETSLRFLLGQLNAKRCHIKKNTTAMDQEQCRKWAFSTAREGVEGIMQLTGFTDGSGERRGKNIFLIGVDPLAFLQDGTPNPVRGDLFIDPSDPYLHLLFIFQRRGGGLVCKDVELLCAAPLKNKKRVRLD
jgi:hypothetical protein